MAAPRKINKERRKRKERILREGRNWHGPDVRQMLERGCPALPQGELRSVGAREEGVRATEVSDTYDPQAPYWPERIAWSPEVGAT